MNLKTVILVTLTLLETFLFGGLITGWSSLVYVLKDNGIFADLCNTDVNNGGANASITRNIEFTKNKFINTDEKIIADASKIGNNTSHICKEQDSRLNLIFTIAVAVGNISIILIGIADSKLGTQKTRTIFMILFTAGALSIAFTSKDLPWLILPGLYLVTIGGFSLLITNVRVSFTLKYGSDIYIGLLNGCFDTSAVVQLLVKILYENGVSIRFSYIGITLLQLIIVCATTYLHPTKKTSTEQNIEGSEDTSKEQNDTESSDVQIKTSKNEDRVRVKDNQLSLFTNRKSIYISIFCLHICWFSIATLRFFYFIGSVNYRLEISLKDPGLVGYFTNVFAYTMFGGIVMSFVAGTLCEWQKQCFRNKKDLEKSFLPQVLPLALCSGLTIMISALEFSSEQDLFYATFVLVVMLRGFAFAINMGFIASVYPIEYVTFLLGLNSAVSGIVSFTQYALFSWNEQYDTAPYHVSGCLVALGIVSLGHPINTYIQAYRNRK